jgi:hypothetical protein
LGQKDYPTDEKANDIKYITVGGCGTMGGGITICLI